MSDAVKRAIVTALLPWNDEMSPKWAPHDSARQAEDVLRSLDEAGFVVVRKERLGDN